MAASAEKLLDFSSPFDVALLDATVNVFYTSASTEEVRGALTVAPRARGAREAAETSLEGRSGRRR